MEEINEDETCGPRGGQGREQKMSTKFDVGKLKQRFCLEVLRSRRGGFTKMDFKIMGIYRVRQKNVYTL